MNEICLAKEAWQPLSLEEAEALWKQLESAKAEISKQMPEESADFWIVGEHGNLPVAVVLLKDRRLALVQLDKLPTPRLPRIGHSAGPYSLYYCLGDICDRKEKPVRCPEAGVRQIPERLRQVFVHLATQPEPKANRLEPYDNGRETLSIKGAETIAERALSLALESARPAAKDAFADQWASAAHLFAMGGQADFSLLTQQGAEQLRLLCTRNVHCNKSDIIAKGRKIDERLDAEQRVTRELGERRLVDDAPYLDARRASTAAFQAARGRSLNGRATNLKPFSQRFIKGLIISKVAKARLSIGTLSNAISPSLAEQYGEILRFFQDTVIIATGRLIPELAAHKETFSACGIHSTSDLERKVLPQPRIVFKADIVMLDPRTIFHEFQHARQHSASEEPLENFKMTSRYETEIIEWKAKQAEADFTNRFGILY